MDSQYAQKALEHMYNQLVFHSANLYCAIKRNDVIVCDIPMEKATTCLVKCTDLLHRQIELLEKLVTFIFIFLNNQYSLNF